MTTPEFKRAFAIATSEADLSNEDIGVFDGFGLRAFKPVVVSLRQLAKLIRWQALSMGDSRVIADNDNLNEIKVFGKAKFIIAG